jgi:hypothetical protein
MAMFQENEGIAPHIEVPTNITEDSKMDARRP